MVCITALWEQLPKTDCKSPRPIPGHPFTLKPCNAYVLRGSSDRATWLGAGRPVSWESLAMASDLGGRLRISLLLSQLFHGSPPRLRALFGRRLCKKCCPPVSVWPGLAPEATTACSSRYDYL